MQAWALWPPALVETETFKRNLDQKQANAID
jgi:hypothetical protein